LHVVQLPVQFLIRDHQRAARHTVTG
jgi:hypothetical protein